MYRVLQKVHGTKANLLSADAYEKRVKKVEKQQNKEKDSMRKTMQGTGVSGIFSSNDGNESIDGKAELQKGEL